MLSVQDMLDGNGFSQTTSALEIESGRERTGVLLQAILAYAGVQDWNNVRLIGALGVITEVGRSRHDSSPDQYLLYWSSDGNPSATLTFTNPQDGLRVIDVTDVLILD